MFWPQLRATVLTVFKNHCRLSNKLLLKWCKEFPCSVSQRQSVIGCLVSGFHYPRLVQRICYLNTLSHFNWVLRCAEEHNENICSLVHSYIEPIRLLTLCMLFGISKLCHLLLSCLDQSERKLFTDVRASMHCFLFLLRWFTK